MEGVDGQEHVQEAGQLLEVAAGAAGEPGQWAGGTTSTTMCELI